MSETASNTAQTLRQRMLSRRQFLDSSARNAAGVAAIGVVGMSQPSAASDPESPVRVGVIGIRNQGRLLARTFASLNDVSVTHLCDVDRNLILAADKAVREEQGSGSEWTDDYRRLLDDARLDAVVIATPDHWHETMARDALAAGKHVYLETPITHTPDEARALLAAHRDSRSVVQCGLAHRSAAHFQSAIEYLRSGDLGDVKLAKAWTTHRRRSIGTSNETEPPQGVEYSAWLGPAGPQPFRPNRFHYHWRWFWDFGSGELGNWGVQLLDVAAWGLDVAAPRRVSSVGGKLYFHDEQETPDTQQVLYDFGEKTITWEHRQWSNHANEGRSAGVAFYGENGTLIVDRGGWKVYGRKDGRSCEGRDATAEHCRNFADAVRGLEAPAAGLEAGYRATQLCHLGNHAHCEGREIVVDEWNA